MGAFSFGPFRCWTFVPLPAWRQYENLSARASTTPNDGGSCQNNERDGQKLDAHEWNPTTNNAEADFLATVVNAVRLRVATVPRRS